MSNIETLVSQAAQHAKRVGESMNAIDYDLKIPGLSLEDAKARNSLDEAFFESIVNLEHLEKYKSA